MLHQFIYESNGQQIRTSHCVDDSAMCWCKPDKKQFCSEREEDGFCRQDCWRCEGAGFVDVYDDELPIVVVHKKEHRTNDLTYFCVRCSRAIIDYRMHDGALCDGCKQITRTKF